MLVEVRPFSISRANADILFLADSGISFVNKPSAVHNWRNTKSTSAVAAVPPFTNAKSLSLILLSINNAPFDYDKDLYDDFTERVNAEASLFILHGNPFSCLPKEKTGKALAPRGRRSIKTADLWL